LRAVDPSKQQTNNKQQAKLPPSDSVLKAVVGWGMPFDRTVTCRGFAPLPTTLSADESGGGVGIHFVREIVWPDGRREVEGTTPKSLPAASHALPKPTDPIDDTDEGGLANASK